MSRPPPRPLARTALSYPCGQPRLGGGGRRGRLAGCQAIIAWAAFQAAGVDCPASVVGASPGLGSASRRRGLIPRRRQISVTEAIAAALGPACGPPMRCEVRRLHTSRAAGGASITAMAAASKLVHPAAALTGLHQARSKGHARANRTARRPGAQRPAALQNPVGMPQPQPAFLPAATGGPVAVRLRPSPAKALWQCRKPSLMHPWLDHPRRIQRLSTPAPAGKVPPVGS